MPEPVKEVPEPEQVLKSLYQVGRVQSDSFAWTEPGCGVGKTGLRDGPREDSGPGGLVIRESNIGQQRRTAEKGAEPRKDAAKTPEV